MLNTKQTENKSVPFWLWPNVLGLDAPIVAVVWQYLFAVVFEIKIPASNYLALFLVVWVIYSADRLLDAKMLSSKKNSTTRHNYYHQNYRVLFFITAIIATVTAVICLTSIPFAVLKFGLMISCFVIVYFIHRKWGRGGMIVFLPKEIFVGLVFAIGTTLIGYTWTREIPDVFLSIPVIGFGVLCSMNCLAISVWEKDSDAFNDNSALPQLLPQFSTHFPLISLIVFLIMSFVTYTLFRSEDFLVLLAASLGCGMISLISFFGQRFSNQLIRVLADVAVLAPALLIIIFLK